MTIFFVFFAALGESQASEDALPGQQAQGGDGPASRQTLAGAAPPGGERHSTGLPELPAAQAPEED